MMKCPKCQATLPDDSSSCQFCGAIFGTPVRSSSSRSPSSRPSSNSDKPVNLKWVQPAYYAIAGWWVLSGLFQLVMALSGGRFSIDLIIGGVTAIVGLGLIFKVEAARGIVNIISWLQILSGIFTFGIGFLMSSALGSIGALIMILAVVNVVLAGLMIFLIGETDSGMRDI